MKGTIGAGGWGRAERAGNREGGTGKGAGGGGGMAKPALVCVPRPTYGGKEPRPILLNEGRKDDECRD